jgi:hypothetical protein
MHGHAFIYIDFMCVCVCDICAVCINIYKYIYNTHTHTHIYIYIYAYTLHMHTHNTHTHAGRLLCGNTIGNVRPAVSHGVRHRRVRSADRIELALVLLHRPGTRPKGLCTWVSFDLLSTVGT